MSKLSNKILDYTKSTKLFYPPYLWEEWGVEPEEFTKALCKVWYKFPNPRIVDNLLDIDVDEEPVYYEICNQKFNRGRYIHRDELWSYCIENNIEDQHISVFAHDGKWISNYQKKKTVSCQGTKVGADYIYLELDRPTLEEAIDDAIRFYVSFPYKDYVSIWHSGNKSAHIQIDSRLFGRPMGQQENLAGRYKLIYNIAHDIAGDLRHGNSIKDPYRLNKNEIYKAYYQTFKELPEKNVRKIEEYRSLLENIDPNLFSTNSLIRQPYSIHETGGELKRLISKDKKFIEKKIGLDFYPKNNYINKTPKLIHKIFNNYKECKHKDYTADVDSTEVIKVFSKTIDRFNPEDADGQGWCGPYYNPLYDDTNPSVFVNLESGYIYDHGSYNHSMSFDKFKKKIRND